MKVAGAWLEAEGCQTVLMLLTRAGHQAYAVGGCVRNALLAMPVADVDIATDARPEQVLALATAAELKVIPTGIAHGTLTLIASGTAYEVTSFRRDVETNGRHAVVAFATDIHADAERRDFTMNALYAAADGTVHDPLGRGIADAQRHHIRFVGDAAARIREDYLRILRFFRFYAHYGLASDGPDPEALAACAALADGLAGLSHERVGAELRKLLEAPDPAPSVAAMQASGVLQHCLPGADSRALPVLVHLESTLLSGTALPPRWLRRLVTLCPGVPAAEMQKLLRLSRAETDAVARLQKAVQDGGSPAALGHVLGTDAATDALLARAALLEQMPAPNWQAEVARGSATAFPVEAADLMPGLSGAALGARLKALKDHWLAENLRPDRARLLALPRQ